VRGPEGHDPPRHHPGTTGPEEETRAKGVLATPLRTSRSLTPGALLPGYSAEPAVDLVTIRPVRACRRGDGQVRCPWLCDMSNSVVCRGPQT
jgi:hypothetical protein